MKRQFRGGLILLAAWLLAGCAAAGGTAGAESSPSEEGGLLRANRLPAGEDYRVKCPAGETMMCINHYRVSDGRTAVDTDEDQANCRCRPFGDLQHIW